MNDVRTRPALPKAARYFSLAVAALVFCGMLAFGAWIVASSVRPPRPEIVRAGSGTNLGIAALVLLASLRGGWRSGEPFQHDRRFILGMALFGIGTTVLIASA